MGRLAARRRPVGLAVPGMRDAASHTENSGRIFGYATEHIS